MGDGVTTTRPFHWTLKREGIIGPDERLPWPQTIALGIQHIFAMFGATVLAPILMGFDPNTAILFSGVGTLLFFVVVGGRVPSYLGSSFSFITVVIAASAYAGAGPNPNLAVALGGIVAAGAVYAVIGLVVMRIGYAWVEFLMPPVVTGAVVMVIGLNLAHIAVGDIGALPSWAAGAKYDAFAAGMGLFTVLAVAFVTVYAPGLLRRLPILVGGIVGYVVYLVLANGLGMTTAVIDFKALGDAAWIGMPNLTAPKFESNAIFLIAPIAIVLVAENLGHVKAVAAMTGRNLDPYLGRAFLGDGLATMIAGAGGGTGVTTYAENIGVMAVTRIYSSLVFVIAGVVAVVDGLLAQVRRPDRDDPDARHRWPGDRAVRADRRHRRPDLGPEQGRLLGEPEPRHGRRGADPGCRRPDPQRRRLLARRHRHGDVRRDHRLPAAPDPDAEPGGARRRRLSPVGPRPARSRNRSVRHGGVRNAAVARAGRPVSVLRLSRRAPSRA